MKLHVHWEKVIDTHFPATHGKEGEKIGEKILSSVYNYVVAGHGNIEKL